LVCGEALRDVSDDGYASTDACFKCDGPAEMSGAVEEFGTVLRQEGFVGGNDIGTRVK
jgi:hypothetical protein